MPDLSSKQSLPNSDPFDASNSEMNSRLIKNTIKIILIHDSNILREGLISLFTKFKDIEVLAHSGDTINGMHLISEHQPDVLLTDFAIDGISSFELTKHIKLQHPKTQILFLLSQITDSNIERGLVSGASGFLSKNETIEGISNAIRYVHMGKKYFSEEIKKRLVSRNSYDPQQHSFTPRRALLSPREIEVLCCVAKGLKAKNIGKNLHITAKTVERHKSNIMAKLGLHSQVDLAIFAIKEGYIHP